MLKRRKCVWEPTMFNVLEALHGSLINFLSSGDEGGTPEI